MDDRLETEPKKIAPYKYYSILERRFWFRFFIQFLLLKSMDEKAEAEQKTNFSLSTITMTF